MKKIDITCFTDDECYNISDIFAYLYQYERDIVRNNDVHMLMFCADIALKRLYLFDKFSFCFVSSLKRDEILSEIRDHIENGRCTEHVEETFNEYLKG